MAFRLFVEEMTKAVLEAGAGKALQWLPPFHFPLRCR